MNSLKINKIILLILLLASIISLNMHITSIAETSDNFELNQVEPNIVITTLVMSNNLPDEGEEITATLTIENKDNANYSNLLIQLTLFPESAGHDNDGGDELKVGNAIIQQFGALEKQTLEIAFTAPAGLYVATAVLIFNNFPIQNSQNSIPIQVLSPKIGDNQTPIAAIIVLALFFILILLSQAMYDSIKLKKVILESNGK